MISRFSKLHWTKKIAILILLIWVFAFFIGNIKEQYRGTWFYPWLSIFSLITFFGSAIWSFINSILMYKELEMKSKQNLFWLIFSAFPFFVVTIVMSIILIKSSS